MGSLVHLLPALLGEYDVPVHEPPLPLGLLDLLEAVLDVVPEGSLVDTDLL